MTSISSTLEPMRIWSRDTGQQTPCFDKCQLTIPTWMSNNKGEGYKSRLHVSVNLLTAAIVHDFVVIAVVQTRPRVILLARITMRKSIHGLPFLSYLGMGLHLAASWAARAPLITKAPFTRREGYPSKRVNPSWRAKDSPGLQAKFHRQGNPTTRDNLMRGYTQRVWKQ